MVRKHVKRWLCAVGLVGMISVPASAPVCAQDRAWLQSLPDPDGFMWEQRDRPGYRYRDMTPAQQRFYYYIQEKRMEGKALSGVEVLMIRSLQAARRWPEAPRPNRFWAAYIKHLREQPPERLNTAHRIMLAQGMALGVLPADPELNPDMQQLVDHLRSDSFRARNWFERWFGRAEAWAQFVATTQGVDMRGLRFVPGVVPAEPFNGVQIRYAVSGAELGEPHWQINRVVRGDGTEEVLGTNYNSRYYEGTTSFDMSEGGPGMPGRVTVMVTVTSDGSRPISGEILLQYTGPKPDYQRFGVLPPELLYHRERFNFGEWNGAPQSVHFHLSVPTWPMCARIIRSNPQDTDLSGLSTTGHVGFYVSTKVGEHPYYSSTMDGPRVAFRLDSCPVAMAACADRSARAAADAAWRAQVEKTLQELGYEQTAAGRELGRLRAGLEGGEGAWQQYVNRSTQELAGTESEVERAFDALRAAMDSGGPAWTSYIAAGGGGAPPPPSTPPATPATPTGPPPAAPTQPTTAPPGHPADLGGLAVGTTQSGGQLTGAAEQFNQTGQVTGVMKFEGLPQGSTAVGIWSRDGVEVTRSEQKVGGTGWMSFTLRTADAGGLRSGVYTLTITVGGKVIGRKTFTIGQGAG